MMPRLSLAGYLQLLYLQLLLVAHVVYVLHSL